MKICLVGGIFDRAAAVRSKHLLTPETVLLDGFRQRGVDVHPIGHAGFQPSDEFDIVHVHHIGRAALKMASLPSRARFVFTGHNGQVVTGWEKSRLRRFAFQYVVDKADAFVALSHAEARHFAKVTRPEKIHTIPNGIPADIFHVNEKNNPRDSSPRSDILYVGQLIDWKGVNFLLDALALLRTSRDVRLRLVYHNAELEFDLKRQAAELGILDFVEFVGIRGPSELAAEYQQADLLVLPSFADCLPSVITEAYLCGTPVVAGAVCGVPEQIGNYGIAVPPGDARALANAMETILADQLRYRALAQEMREYARTKFNPDSMVDAHMALYRNLLAGQACSFPRQSARLDFAVRVAVDLYWRSPRAAS